MSKTVKLCECGCGEPTKLAKATSKRYDQKKGKPLRFIHGHNGRKEHCKRGHKLDRARTGSRCLECQREHYKENKENINKIIREKYYSSEKRREKHEKILSDPIKYQKYINRRREYDLKHREYINEKQRKRYNTPGTWEHEHHNPNGKFYIEKLLRQSERRDERSNERDLDKLCQLLN